MATDAEDACRPSADGRDRPVWGNVAAGASRTTRTKKPMPDPKFEVHRMASGDVDVWVDPGGGICLKSRGVDPVELSEGEAVELAELLLRLAKEQSL